MAKNLVATILILAFFSCRPENKAGTQNSTSYFDLKGYFEKEISRYAEQKPTVEKTVAINGNTESKKTIIKDWPRELAVFIDADINKSAWKGAFKIKNEGNGVHYTTLNEKIPVKEISVFRHLEKVNKIEVIIANHNLLYHSNDTLTYYPDSLYQIIKSQKIRLMEGKRYKIVGRIE